MAQEHDDGSRIEAELAHGHDDHDEHDAGGHGAADPNAGVLVATPPTPAWVMTAVAIAVVTIAVCVVLAIVLNNAGTKA
jgi:hypothetical protein